MIFHEIKNMMGGGITTVCHFSSKVIFFVLFKDMWKFYDGMQYVLSLEYLQD